MVPPQRVSVGRHRIEIREIESEEARQTCFFNRRAGLFNKASALSTLCGAQVVAVVFSPGGKVFSLGHPSVDFVLDRFLSETPEAAVAVPAAAEVGGEEKRRHRILEELNKKCGELRAKVEKEKVQKEYWKKRMAVARAKNGRAAAWIENARMAEENVEDYRVALMNVKEFVKVRTDLVLRNAPPTRSRAPLPSAPTGAGNR